MRPSHVDHIPELLARFENKPSNLVPILEAIIDEYTFLPEDAAHQIAMKLKLPVADVMQVAHGLADPNRVTTPVEV
ncbi:MAG TPA: NAD(P)H-dependent oxidoreductase subunit E [Terriglobales bacterium]|nr:NAD(P)H-dependent oxidoreductase subunit E [Terriglobales bacterium]